MFTYVGLITLTPEGRETLDGGPARWRGSGSSR
jgi:hypothetical protein